MNGKDGSFVMFHLAGFNGLYRYLIRAEESSISGQATNVMKLENKLSTF